MPEKSKMIDYLCAKAADDDEMWLALTDTVLGCTRLDWLAAQLEDLDEWRLGILYEAYGGDEE